MKKLSLIVCVLLAGFAVAEESLSVPLQVQNVSFRQSRMQQSVVVDYDLVSSGDPAVVQLDILTNGVSIGLQNIRSVSGDVSRSLQEVVAPGTGKSIVWNARNDWRGNISSNAVAVVRAYYTNALYNVRGVYMVVDLSAGSAATSYPVSYTLSAPDLTDSANFTTKLWLRRVQAGTFLMGSPSDEYGRQNNETRHVVTLSESFLVSVFPVTREQWRLVMGSVKNDQNNHNGASNPVTMVSYADIRGTSPAWPDSTEVSSTSFCGVLRAKTGIDTFDLPTEAQWEYACRAGTTTALNNGCNVTNDTSDANATAVAWCRPESNSNFGSLAVGQKLPNAWGLYDMHGNVYEPCLDWYGGDYGSAAVTDPRGASSGTTIVYRSGAYGANPTTIRSACRRTDKGTNVVDGGYGFRLFCTIR